ncbi:MAG: HEPN domain-containing protein [Deltaproteobacteria bacterium]|nr:HEPN domain-containing protein [Deltaproteobacteria bacterium]
MDVELHIDFWRAGAREDWDVGAGLVRDGKTRHGLFFVHLALEKALKALVTRKTVEVPPRIHNLVVLAEAAGLQLAEGKIQLLAEMNEFQIAGRYPKMLPKPPPQGEADAIMQRAEEVFTWLMQQ